MTNRLNPTGSSRSHTQRSQDVSAVRLQSDHRGDGVGLGREIQDQGASQIGIFEETGGSQWAALTEIES